MGKSKLLFVYFIIGVILIIFNLILYSLVAPGYDPKVRNPTFDLYAKLLTTVWAGVTTITCFMVMGVFTLKSPPGKVWCLLGIGFVCWCIGEGIFTYYIALDIDPFPSIADFFYIVGYPFLIGGLVLQQRSTKASLAKSETVIVLTVIIAVITVSVYYVFIPIIDLYIIGEYDLLSAFIIILYPVMDWFLLPSVLILFFRFKGGEFSKSWIIEFVGYVMLITADLVFAIVEANGVPMAAFYYDHLFDIAYFLLGLGALHLVSTLKGN